MEYIFTKEQEEIITGSLLGDCHISEQKSINSNCYFCKKQARRRKDYLQWHFDKLLPFSSSINDGSSIAKGKEYPNTIFITKTLPIFTELRNKWYPNGVKVVPKDVKLSPLAIAIWFFDDGYNFLKKRRCSFATYCFTKEECYYLMDKLQEFNLNTYLDNRNVICVKSDSYKILVEIIKPYMLWECFEYKIVYRDPLRTFLTNDEKERILVMYQSGISIHEIAKFFNRSLCPIYALINKSRKDKSLPLSNTSGIKNVHWDKSRNKWKVLIVCNGKKYTRRFNIKEEAMCFVQHIREQHLKISL